MKTSEPDSPALRLLASQRPLVIGHRGCCRFAPENTLPSFKLALEAGADLVELDYRECHDGVPVVIHDETLDRTTDARKQWGQKRIRVADKTAAEIQGLDAGSWFDPRFAGTPVPLLSQALDFIRSKGSVALIERKAGAAAAFVQWLRSLKLVHHVVVIAFDWSYLRALHDLEPNVVLGALGPAALLASGRKPAGIARKLSAAWLDHLAATGAKVVVWNRRVSRGAVRMMHEHGLKVWIYTINDAALAGRLLGLGVDGLITNDPSMARRTVASRRV